MSPRFRIEAWLAGGRSTVYIGLASLALLVVIMFMSWQTFPGLRADTSANRRSDELASCRDEFRSAIDRATDRTFSAFGDVQVISANATVDRQDAYTMGEAKAALGPATEELLAALEEYSQATAAYEKANAIARENPGEFLDTCKEIP